jgi:hypothetical protein
MGNTNNVQPTSLRQIPDYFAVTFGHSNKLRILGAQDNIVNRTESLVTSFWQVEDLTKLPGFVEFKLSHYPLERSSNKTSTQHRFKFMMCSLLRAYYGLGWRLKCSPILQHYGENGSSLIFERDQPLDTSIICLSKIGWRKISFMGPDHLVRSIRATIQTHLPRGIESETNFEEYWEFKLSCDESELVSFILVELFKCLDREGWQFCGSISSGENNEGLYFRYEPSSANNVNTFEYFAVSLSYYDRIKLVNLVPNLVTLTRNTIKQVWNREIQDETFSETKVHEFKLRGNPWLSRSDNADGKRLVNRLLANLIANKCELKGTFSGTERISTFIFRLNRTETIDPNLIDKKMFCVGIDHVDLLNIFSEGDFMFLDVIRRSIGEGWDLGIQDESANGSNHYDFKLYGYPFAATKNYPVNVCLLLNCLLVNLKAFNVNLVCTADLSNHSNDDGYIDAHTLFFKFSC